MKKDIMTLWVVSATNGSFSRLCHVYAHDEEEARVKVAPWLELYKHLTQREFRMCPSGFVINQRELPGSISFDI